MQQRQTLPCLQKNWIMTRSVSMLLTDIWHCSTLRSMEVRHRKRGNTDLQTNRHILEKINTSFILSVATVQGWEKKKMSDVPSWRVCIWLSHCSAQIPVCSVGRTAVRRGSRSMQSEKNSPPSVPAFTTETERRGQRNASWCKAGKKKKKKKSGNSSKPGENTLIIWLEQWEIIQQANKMALTTNLEFKEESVAHHYRGQKGQTQNESLVIWIHYYNEKSSLIVIYSIFISNAWQTSQLTVCNVK